MSDHVTEFVLRRFSAGDLVEKLARELARADGDISVELEYLAGGAAVNIRVAGVGAGTLVSRGSYSG